MVQLDVYQGPVLCPGEGEGEEVLSERGGRTRGQEWTAGVNDDSEREGKKTFFGGAGIFRFIFSKDVHTLSYEKT